MLPSHIIFFLPELARLRMPLGRCRTRLLSPSHEDFAQIFQQGRRAREHEAEKGAEAAEVTLQEAL